VTTVGCGLLSVPDNVAVRFSAAGVGMLALLD
jgi:hypothetical protein